jgi:aminomethyltransferase
LKRTPLYNIHRRLNAKIVEFAGFEMPVEYSSILNEHMTVRQRVGVFDVSHMGEIWIKGPNALSFIQKVTSNDAAVLLPGQAQYSCLPNGNGGIVDDLLVYRYETEKYLMVVNASNIQKDYDWLISQNNMGAVLENSSDKISQLAVQGPRALKVLQKLTENDLSAIKYYTFTVDRFAGIDDVIISATGYTGAGGFELYFYNEHAEHMWEAIFDAGREEGIEPIGLGARDTLRLEMGYCLYGNDIDDTTSPIEAGLGWITKFIPGKEFIDMDRLLQQKENGVSIKLRGFEMIDRGIPRHGYNIAGQDGKVIGHVTSGTQSPILGKGIGMGYVDSQQSTLGTEIFILVRDKKLNARIVKMPFI